MVQQNYFLNYLHPAKILNLQQNRSFRVDNLLLMLYFRVLLMLYRCDVFLNSIGRNISQNLLFIRQSQIQGY